MCERGSLGMWVTIAVAILAAVSAGAGPEAGGFRLSLDISRLSVEAVFGAVSLRIGM